MNCVICRKDIGSPEKRVTCDEHVDDFMASKREMAKPRDFSTAYYRQKRKKQRAEVRRDKTPEYVKCRYCQTGFYRTGTGVFCPDTDCYDKWHSENRMSADYSQISASELRDMYYDKDMSIEKMAAWFRDNRKIKISGFTVRKLMKDHGITHEGKLGNPSKLVEA